MPKSNPEQPICYLNIPHKTMMSAVSETHSEIVCFSYPLMFSHFVVNPGEPLNHLPSRCKNKNNSWRGIKLTGWKIKVIQKVWVVLTSSHHLKTVQPSSHLYRGEAFLLFFPFWTWHINKLVRHISHKSQGSGGEGSELWPFHATTRSIAPSWPAGTCVCVSDGLPNTFTASNQLLSSAQTA